MATQIQRINGATCVYQGFCNMRMAPAVFTESMHNHHRSTHPLG